MEVGPFRTVPPAQTSSGKAELKLVEGGWEEYATMVFGEQLTCVFSDRSRPASRHWSLDRPC